MVGDDDRVDTLVDRAPSVLDREVDAPRPNRGNAQIFDFTLSDEDMDALDTLEETGGTERRHW